VPSKLQITTVSYRRCVRAGSAYYLINLRGVVLRESSDESDDSADSEHSSDDDTASADSDGGNDSDESDGA